MSKTIDTRELQNIFLYVDHVGGCAASDGAECSCGLGKIQSGLDEFLQALQNAGEKLEIWM